MRGWPRPLTFAEVVEIRGPQPLTESSTGPVTWRGKKVDIFGVGKCLVVMSRFSKNLVGVDLKGLPPSVTV